MWRMGLLATLSACSLYFNSSDPEAPPPDSSGGAPAQLDLVVTRSFAGELPIAGFTADGHGGLWLLYNQLPPNNDFADVRIVHVDGSGTKLSEWRYPDEYLDARGLALVNGTLYVGYAGLRDYWSDRIRRIDASTGSELGTYVAGADFVDLAERGGQLVVPDPGTLIGVDATTGAEAWRRAIPTFANNTLSGVAMAGDRAWVSSWYEGVLEEVDASGAVIAKATIPALGRSVTVDDGWQLAWDGSQLLVMIRGQIYWLSPAAGAFP